MAQSCIASQPSCGSTAVSSQQELGVNKIKLRLIYGGHFEQTENHTYKFVGGEYFNESIPYGIRYADFMFKLSEKFKAAVSVKYLAPGEELVPDQLISVQDDADLQELIEDYLAHLQRPGTPCKTFRIKVFVFMAAEEPMTPDEIMEGQHFFSECHQGNVRVPGCRWLDGRSSLGSTLSSVGTPSTRQQDLSAGDWPSSNAGQAASMLPEDLLPEEPFDEQEALERMRMAVSFNPSQRLRQQQRRLSALAGEQQAAEAAVVQQAAATGAAGSGMRVVNGVLEGFGAAEYNDSAYDDSAYEDDVHVREDDIDAAQLAEVLAAIQQEQERREAAAAAVTADGGAMLVELVQPASEADISLPADPWEVLDSAVDVLPQDVDEDFYDQDDDFVEQEQQPAQEPQEELQQQPRGHGLHDLPSHISAFGDASDTEEASPATQGSPAAAPTAGGQGVLQLPSHISAFGDDLGPLQGGCAVLSGSEELEEGLTANGEAGLSDRLGFGRPRTQDSSFSLDGDMAGEGDMGPSGAGGVHAERASSGDSLASLPKLQPVHRLAKPDLKIVQRIGEGAFGEVSVAKAPLYGTVAVKWLKSERFTKHFASFGREAALLADLNHPNVLRFYGIVTESAADTTVIGIMTEYIRGGSMSSFLRMSNSQLPLRVRCELALGAANGLAYLHELRIVHFDLKPDNLLLDAPPVVVRAAAGAGLEEPASSLHLRGSMPAGAASPANGGYADASSRGGAAAGAIGSGSSQEQLLQRPGGNSSATTSPAGGVGVAGAGVRVARVGRTSSGPGTGSGSGLLDPPDIPVVKVADFGLSKHKLNSSYVSSCRDLRGTLPYMAPELVADPERVCEKADVWSLGVVMWEMLTREIPFQALAPQQILMGLMCGNLHLDVPEWCEPEWRGLLEACLEPNPCNRPTMRELARQLEAIRDQQLLHDQQELAQEQLLQEEQQQQAHRVVQVPVPAASEESVPREAGQPQTPHVPPASAPAPVALLQQLQQQQQQQQPVTVQHLAGVQTDLQQQFDVQQQRVAQLEHALASHSRQVHALINQQQDVPSVPPSGQVSAQQQQQYGCAVQQHQHHSPGGMHHLQPT